VNSDGVIAMKHCLQIGILALTVGSMALAAYAKGEHCVPDEATAVRDAEAALIPIYGRKHIESEWPFTAKLTGNVWKVSGYLPPNMDGGVAEIWIDKRNGLILRYIHGK
jgi:hypothetical protein